MKKLIVGSMLAALLFVPVSYAQAEYGALQVDPQDFPAGNTFLYFPIAPLSGGFSWVLAIASVTGVPTFINVDSLFLTGGAQAATITLNFGPRDVQFHFPASEGGDVVCPPPGCQLFVHRPTFSFWSLLFVLDSTGGFSIVTPLFFQT